MFILNDLYLMGRFEFHTGLFEYQENNNSNFTQIILLTIQKSLMKKMCL